MTAIICEDHGHQLALLVCPHIEERYRRKDMPEEMVSVRGTMPLFDISAELFLCCSECSVTYGFGQQNGDIEYFDVPQEFGDALCPICHLCFEAWESKKGQDRRTGMGPGRR